MDHTKIAQQLNEIFEGLNMAYGTYQVPEGKKVGEKLKGRAATIKEPVTVKLWVRHFDGTSGIGIVPINEESKCKFGAIDVDVYTGVLFTDIIKKIDSFNLPLIPCRSKSGGCHIFMFTKEFVPALLFQNKLKEVAAALGYGDCEIYPRQTELLIDRGDMGQWLNMPYFDNMRGKRYGIHHDGTPMPVEEFIALVKTKQLSEEELEKLSVTMPDDLADGPPCLQHLINQGFPEGTRNDGLFNLGVYARLASPDNWKSEVERYNNLYMNPPLKSTEIQGVIKSLNKKDYMYACSKAPLKPHCNSQLCRSRKYGVGNNGGLPTLSNLTKFDSDPPIWFVDVEGMRIELSTDDLQSQARFQKRCMEKLNMMPPRINNGAWQQMIQHLLDGVAVISAPIDASMSGQMFEMLERFCTQKAQANVMDEILLGKPFFDGGRYFFRISDFMNYLERHHFREFKVNKITSMIRDRDGQHHFVNLKGRGTNCWSIPGTNKQMESFDAPPIKSEVPY